MTLGIVYAESLDGIFGKNNTLPWHCPADLAHFKAVTEGCTVIMGWRTMKSLGKPLPNRHNVVVSDRPKSVIDGFSRVHPDDLGELAMFMRSSTLGLAWVIGGARLIEFVEPWATLAHRSVIGVNVPDGHVAAPRIDWSQWKEPEIVAGDGFIRAFYER